MLAQEKNQTESPKIESINVKIPLELYEKIREHADWLSYPIEELTTFDSKIAHEACEKTRRLMDEVEALNDFWLHSLDKLGDNAQTDESSLPQETIVISLPKAVIKYFRLLAHLQGTTEENLIQEGIIENLDAVIEGRTAANWKEEFGLSAALKAP